MGEAACVWDRVGKKGLLSKLRKIDFHFWTIAECTAGWCSPWFPAVLGRDQSNNQKSSPYLPVPSHPFINRALSWVQIYLRWLIFTEVVNFFFLYAFKVGTAILPVWEKKPRSWSSGSLWPGSDCNSVLLTLIAEPDHVQDSHPSLPLLIFHWNICCFLKLWRASCVNMPKGKLYVKNHQRLSPSQLGSSIASSSILGRSMRMLSVFQDLWLPETRSVEHLIFIWGESGKIREISKVLRGYYWSF